MSLKKLILLIALIVVVGFGNNVMAGHRRHHHHHGCGHGGWSFGLHFVIPLNPAPRRTLVLIPEHYVTKKVWVEGHYEIRSQPPVNVWISEHYENKLASCGHYHNVLIAGHYELQSQPSVNVWVPGHWTKIKILVPEHYEER